MALRFATWGGEPLLERDVFGTVDGERIAAVVDDFCHEHLGARVAGYEFFATSIGSVHGLRLEDDRRVVVKAHRPRVSIDHLAAVQHVQTRLGDTVAFPRRARCSGRPLSATASRSSRSFSTAARELMPMSQSFGERWLPASRGSSSGRNR